MILISNDINRQVATPKKSGKTSSKNSGGILSSIWFKISLGMGVETLYYTLQLGVPGSASFLA